MDQWLCGHVFRRSIMRPIPVTLVLASAAYLLIPQIIGAREAARLTPPRSHLWLGFAGRYAHTIVLDDENRVVRVDSDPLYSFSPDDGVSDPFVYAYFQQDPVSGKLIRLNREIPPATFDEARRQIRELRASKLFLYRQGRIVADDF